MGWGWAGKEETVGAGSGSSFPAPVRENLLDTEDSRSPWVQGEGERDPHFDLFPANIASAAIKCMIYDPLEVSTLCAGAGVGGWAAFTFEVKDVFGSKLKECQFPDPPSQCADPRRAAGGIGRPGEVGR